VVAEFKPFMVRTPRSPRMDVPALKAQQDSPHILMRSLTELRFVVHKATLSSLSMEIDEQRIEGTANTKKVTMKEALSDIMAFEHFMRWTLKRYCQECLFSIIEMTQFKTKILEDIQAASNRTWTTSSTPDTAPYVLKIPEECPQSRIVYGKESGDYKTMARALYVKYVKIDSDYEINVDHATRCNLTELMDDEAAWRHNEACADLETMYRLFDGCLFSMFRLLAAVYEEFSKSDSFQLVKVHYMTSSRNGSCPSSSSVNSSIDVDGIGSSAFME